MAVKLHPRLQKQSHAEIVLTAVHDGVYVAVGLKSLIYPKLLLIDLHKTVSVNIAILLLLLFFAICNQHYNKQQ